MLVQAAAARCPASQRQERHRGSQLARHSPSNSCSRQTAAPVHSITGTCTTFSTACYTPATPVRAWAVAVASVRRLARGLPGRMGCRSQRQVLANHVANVALKVAQHTVLAVDIHHDADGTHTNTCCHSASLGWCHRTCTARPPPPTRVHPRGRHQLRSAHHPLPPGSLLLHITLMVRADEMERQGS
jgi:hypothetical protein